MHRRSINATHSLNLSPGRCSANVQIHIIDKCILDLFIKPTALWAMERGSWECYRSTSSSESITPKWWKYESTLRRRVQKAAHAWHYRGAFCILPRVAPAVRQTALRCRLACEDRAAKVIVISPIICSGVLILRVIRQKRNIFSPLNPWRHSGMCQH